MIPRRSLPRQPVPRQSELQALQERLRAAEETLRAIRDGEIDAVMVTAAGRDRVAPLPGAELPYRALLEQMPVGAVTLTPEGRIAYSNGRFADFVEAAPEELIGAPFEQAVLPAQRLSLQSLLLLAHRERGAGEFALLPAGGIPLLVEITLAPLSLGPSAAAGVIAVIVDITERKHQEEVRTRLFEQVMSAQVEERSRFSRELHDETGQSLTAILVGLRNIEESPLASQARAMASQLREVAARTLRDIGRLARGLYPSVLDDLGLPTAVARHVQEFARLHGIEEQTRISGLEAAPLSPLIQNTVYRMLQEALTNVAKHAGARRVQVELRRDPTAVELRVEDDGVGFSLREVTATGRRGLGLHSLQERAALLGGELQIRSEPGQGTTIVARLPIRGA